MLHYSFSRLVLLVGLPIAFVCTILVGNAQQANAQRASAQHKTHRRSKVEIVQPQAIDLAAVIDLIGIRPGLSQDSIERVIRSAGTSMREVPQDTLTHCFADQSIKIFVVDSIMCRLAWMRMSFLFDGTSHRLRRFTLTPRESAIEAGQSDDINSVLLLYFGERWGKPVINFDPPACFKWRSGNTEVRGFIKRGYPVWVMEG